MPENRTLKNSFLHAKSCFFLSREKTFFVALSRIGTAQSIKTINMENITVSTYRGLSLVSGSINIRQQFDLIRGDIYRERVHRLRDAMEAGEPERADRMKKQLPYCTLTATYTKERLAYSLDRYQDIITLDCDDMPAEKLPEFRRLVNECPDTLGNFISPRMHGLKIFVYLTGKDAEALRAELNAAGSVTFAILERYHHRMYALACKRYEALLSTKVDTSGSDIGRGFFVSHDPDAFLSLERLENVKPLTVKLILPTEEMCRSRKRRAPEKRRQLLPAPQNANTGTATAQGIPPPLSPSSSSPIALQVQLDFRKALEYTRRKEPLKTGNRDNFFYCLGNQCYRRHIMEHEAISMAHSHFGTIPDFDPALPIHNAYQYTSKTDRSEEEEKEPKICQIIKFMDEHYEIRRNLVKEQIEFRKIMPATNEKPTTMGETVTATAETKTAETKMGEMPTAMDKTKAATTETTTGETKTATAGMPAAMSAETEPQPFNALRIKDLNTFYVDAHVNRINCTLTDLKAVVDSDYARPFNPFIDYFTTLDTWDGKTDFIGQLTKTVKAADQAFFNDSFRRWLVGMVACAVNEEKQNHQLMLLHGAQGKGKSTFIRRLLPPELKDYYRNGMINPDNNNHLLQMSSCLLINLDEFDTLSPERMQNLKSLITQDVVNGRKVYDIQNYTYIRRASFIASTNNPHCLPDIGENRRILFNTLLDIDYHTPINHRGIYAQAYALYQQGFQYWYENKEITFLNNRNEAFRQKDPIEENLFFYFRAARANDGHAQWYPAAYLLSILSLNGRTLSNAHTKQTLVKVLENHNFRTRRTANGVTEYWVVTYTQEERTANAVLPQHPVQTEIGM